MHLRSNLHLHSRSHSHLRCLMEQKTIHLMHLLLLATSPPGAADMQLSGEILPSHAASNQNNGPYDSNLEVVPSRNASRCLALRLAQVELLLMMSRLPTTLLLVPQVESLQKVLVEKHSDDPLHEL